MIGLNFNSTGTEDKNDRENKSERNLIERMKIQPSAKSSFC